MSSDKSAGRQHAEERAAEQLERAISKNFGGPAYGAGADDARLPKQETGQYRDSGQSRERPGGDKEQGARPEERPPIPPPDQGGNNASSKLDKETRDLPRPDRETLDRNDSGSAGSPGAKG